MMSSDIIKVNHQWWWFDTAPKGNSPSQSHSSIQYTKPWTTASSTPSLKPCPVSLRSDHHTVWVKSLSFLKLNAFGPSKMHEFESSGYFPQNKYSILSPRLLWCENYTENLWSDFFQWKKPKQSSSLSLCAFSSWTICTHFCPNIHTVSCMLKTGAFSSPGSTFCADSFQYLFHPCVTTAACKRSQSFGQKWRWHVTAKHTCTLLSTYVALNEVIL